MARACVSCGCAVPTTAKFCPECGHPVKPVEDDPRFVSPRSYTPQHLADQILGARAGIEGERKQVTVLFADIKGSMEVFSDRDPEAAADVTQEAFLFNAPIEENTPSVVTRYKTHPAMLRLLEQLGEGRG